MQNSSPRPQWKTPLILAGTLAVLGAGAAWMEYIYKPKQKIKDDQANKVMQLKDVPVQQIDVYALDKHFSFRCVDLEAKLCKSGDNSQWEILAPLNAKADSTNLNAFLSALKNLTPTDTIDLSTDPAEKRASLLKDYLLDEAKRKSSGAERIVITPAKGEPITLFVGDTHPIGEGRFALTAAGEKVQDQKVFVVPAQVKNHFGRDLNYWRNKKLFTIAAHTVTSFTLQGPQTKLRAEKKENDWQLQTLNTQETMPGDLENIDSFLSSVTHLGAKAILVEDKKTAAGKAALQGAQPWLSLNLKLENEPKPAVSGTPEKAGDSTAALSPSAKELDLQIYTRPRGPKGPKGSETQILAVVSDADAVYELESSTQTRLNKPLKDFRLTKLITSMDRFTSKRIAVSGTAFGQSPFVLISKDGKWQPEAPKTEFDENKAQVLLDKLSGNRIKDFLTGKAAPKGENEGVVIELGDDKNPTKQKIALWKVGTALYARDLLSSRKETFAVDSGIITQIPWTPEYFNKAAPGVTPSGAPMAPGMEGMPDLQNALQNGQLSPGAPSDDESGEEHSEGDGHDHGHDHGHAH